MRWKIFALGRSLWMFFAVLLALADWPHVRAYDAADLAFWIVATIGLFGYAFEVALLPAAIWRPFSRAFACWLLFSASASLLDVLSLTQAAANGQPPEEQLGLPLIYVIDCFALIAVWRFAEKRTTERPGQKPARRLDLLPAKLASLIPVGPLYGPMVPDDERRGAIMMGWKLFALCFCYYLAIADINALAHLTDIRFAGGVRFAFLHLAAVGLFGYAFRLSLMSAVIWRPFAVGFTCWLCTLSVRLWATRSGMLAQPSPDKWVSFMSIVAVGFVLIAVWRYTAMRAAELRPDLRVPLQGAEVR